jgi:hypothetical protein
MMLPVCVSPVVEMPAYDCEYWLQGFQFSLLQVILGRRNSVDSGERGGAGLRVADHTKAFQQITDASLVHFGWHIRINPFASVPGSLGMSK